MVVERQPLLSRVSTLHSIVKVWKHHKDARLVAKSLSKINILEYMIYDHFMEKFKNQTNEYINRELATDPNGSSGNVRMAE